MRNFWLILVALVLSHCKSREQNELKDAFLESPVDGKHQVVYLDGNTVYRVFCGEDHRFAAETLTRSDCSHADQKLKFEKLDYQKEYKPRLEKFLKIQNPETIRKEIAYLKATLEKLGQRHVEEGLENTNNPNYRSNFEQEIKAIENRLSTLEPQLAQITLFEAIVGSPDGQKKGILDVTQKFKEFAVSNQSLALLAPFGGGGGIIATGGLLEFTHKGAKFSFAAIKAGSFQMGSPDGSKDFNGDGRVDEKDEEVERGPDERPHPVTISRDFLMQTTEVTRGQYKAIIGSYPEEESGNTCTPKVKQDDHPVSCVSWDDAQRFVQRLNAEAGGKVYQLPTEAEWEFATRCGTTGPYSKDTTGPYSKDGVQVSEESLKSANIAWFNGNSNARTNPVGQLEANKCGLHDVHGNVWEWVEDAYQGNYPSEETDPKVATGSKRVLRGGSWFDFAQDCRSAFRFRDSASLRDYNYGFRLLRTNN